MNQKNAYLLAAAAAVSLLILTCLLAIVLVVLGHMRLETAILLLDLMITILIAGALGWGIYAASHSLTALTARPEVHVRLGGPEEETLAGTTGGRGPSIACPLYLENQQPKAGCRLQAVFRLSSNPPPKTWKFAYTSASKPENALRSVTGEKSPKNGDFLLQVPFAENLVIYQTSVFVGELSIQWDPATGKEDLPQQITIQTDIYSLDGASHPTVEKDVIWA